jgi:glycosyltransferase involved in cell wall biosynthesis
MPFADSPRKVAAVTARGNGRAVAILPAYQLEGSIAGIVERTRPHVDHVIVVTDGSRDGTAAAARRAGAIVPLPRDVRGKGRAIRHGIEAARATGAEYAVLMDADGQHLPEELAVLLAPLRSGSADVVIGSRMLGTLRTSRLNVFGNAVLKLISFAVTGCWMTDTESGYRAFRAADLCALPLVAPGYEIETELLLRALHRRLRIVEVPIHVPFAVPGVTPWDGLKVAWFKIRFAARLKLGREPA